MIGLTVFLSSIALLMDADPGGKPYLNEIRIERHKAVPMRDGVTLYADLYRPVKDGRYPTLIVRTPYGLQRDGIHETLIKVAQRGYSVIYPVDCVRSESAFREAYAAWHMAGGGPPVTTKWVTVTRSDMITFENANR